MKSRRHRAIDKADKMICMTSFKHKRTVNKKIIKVLRLRSLEYYKEMKSKLKTYQDIKDYYGV